MRKYLFLITAFGLLTTQVSFAKMYSSSDPDEKVISECEKIVSLCQDAGYTRNGDDGKQLWMDCLKPILMGKNVSGVTADKMDVKQCREGKIEMLEKKLKELKSAR